MKHNTYNVSISSLMLPVRRILCQLCLAAMAGAVAQAQPTFRASQLPAAVGDYCLEYVTANSDPSGLIGPTGGPRVWDFSYAAQSSDFVRDVSVVSPADGGYQASFPHAAYALYYSDKSGTSEWDYYSFNQAGRIYYGSATPASGANVFTPSSMDVPPTVGYGTNWSYVLNVDYGLYTESDTVTAAVDAYGTVILPQLGSFPALRVNQLTAVNESFGGLFVNTFYLREYYWLVPGFDKAVHIVSQQYSSPPPALFTSGYEVRRVFATNTVASAPVSLAGLRLDLVKGRAVLSWSNVLSATGYQVKTAGNPASTNWQVLATPATNYWSEALTSTQRFYRVFSVP